MVTNCHQLKLPDKFRILWQRKNDIENRSIPNYEEYIRQKEVGEFVY